MRKKTRAHRRWQVDYDYLDKLSEDQRAWLEQFTDEYYRSEFGPKPIHSLESQIRDIYNANNAANRDIMSAHPDQVASHRKDVPGHPPSIKIRFYSESDYTQNSANPEDLMLELIDENRPVCTKCQTPLKGRLCQKCNVIHIFFNKAA